MAKFQIAYGLGGGFGGCGDWEDCDATTYEEAQNLAYAYACEEYESYGGLHGLRTIEDIMEEEGFDEEVAYEVWLEERESWLTYKVREV